MYGIHNNHDHIDEGERVKGDRGWEKGEGGRMERGGRKMRETGDKAKRKREKGVEGERKKKRSGRRQFLSFWNHKCTSHPCHLIINFNILFRFQFRDCEGNTLQLYCVPNSEKSHSYMSIERVLRG